MIPTKIKSAAKFLLSFAVALGLFWYVYKDANLAESWAQLQEVNYGWVLLSMLLGSISYFLRAVRWRMLIHPLGYSLSWLNVFNAVMVGYLANLVLPRMGEISRCAVLKKTDQVAFTASLGTVVTERIVDVLMLFLAVALALMVEFENLSAVFIDLWDKQATLHEIDLTRLLLFGLAGFVLLLGLFWLFSKRASGQALSKKLSQLAKELWKGLTSISKMKGQWVFWGASLMIWVIYFLMSYVVFEAMEPTSGLGWRAGIAILVMGGIGMAIPVQGGIGTFHWLVSQSLIYYGIAEADGETFAFLLHTSQFLLVLTLGAMSTIIALMKGKKGTAPEMVLY